MVLYFERLVVFERLAGGGCLGLASVGWLCFAGAGGKGKFVCVLHAYRIHLAIHDSRFTNLI